MADLTRAVQGAIFDRLAAGVTLAPVFSVVPDNTQPPVVVIGDGQFEQIGGKNSDAERHEVIIRSIVGGTSKDALLALMNQVKAALHNQPLTSDDAVLSKCVMTSGTELRDIEEKILVGEQRFFVFAQSA